MKTLILFTILILIHQTFSAYLLVKIPDTQDSKLFFQNDQNYEVDLTENSRNSGNFKRRIPIFRKIRKQFGKPTRGLRNLPVLGKIISYPIVFSLGASRLARTIHS